MTAALCPPCVVDATLQVMILSAKNHLCCANITAAVRAPCYILMTSDEYSCMAATMFPDTEVNADGRFLEFNGGDWFMMLGGFTLAGLLVWLT
jgi:hypothetical protein